MAVKRAACFPPVVTRAVCGFDNLLAGSSSAGRRKEVQAALFRCHILFGVCPPRRGEIFVLFERPRRQALRGATRPARGGLSLPQGNPAGGAGGTSSSPALGRGSRRPDGAQRVRAVLREWGGGDARRCRARKYSSGPLPVKDVAASALFRAPAIAQALASCILPEHSVRISEARGGRLSLWNFSGA